MWDFFSQHVWKLDSNYSQKKKTRHIQNLCVHMLDNTFLKKTETMNTNYPVNVQGLKINDRMRGHLYWKILSYLSGLCVKEMQCSLTGANHHLLFIWAQNQTGRCRGEGRHKLPVMKHTRPSTHIKLKPSIKSGFWEHFCTVLLTTRQTWFSPEPSKFLLIVIVQPLNYSDSTFSYQALCPSVSRGLRRLVEGLLNAKSRPGWEQEGVVLQETPALQQF